MAGGQEQRWRDRPGRDGHHGEGHCLHPERLDGRRLVEACQSGDRRNGEAPGHHHRLPEDLRLRPAAVVDVPAVGAHTQDRDRHRERSGRDLTARRRARGDQHEAVHGRRPHRYVDRRRAGVLLGGRGEEDPRVQLVDHRDGCRAAESVPLELWRRQRRRLAPHRRVRGEVVGGPEGPVGRRRRDDVEDARRSVWCTRRAASTSRTSKLG